MLLDCVMTDTFQNNNTLDLVCIILQARIKCRTSCTFNTIGRGFERRLGDRSYPRHLHGSCIRTHLLISSAEHHKYLQLQGCGLPVRGGGGQLLPRIFRILKNSKILYSRRKSCPSPTPQPRQNPQATGLNCKDDINTRVYPFARFEIHQ